MMDVLEVLRKAEWMRCQVERVEDCLEELSEDDRLVMECLMDGYDEKILRICDLLDVSIPTAYRRVERVKHRISQLFEQKGVIIS